RICLRLERPVALAILADALEGLVDRAQAPSRGDRVAPAVHEQRHVVEGAHQPLPRPPLEVRVIPDSGADSWVRHLQEQRIEHHEVQPRVASEPPRDRVRPHEQPLALGFAGENRLGHAGVSRTTATDQSGSVPSAMTIQTLTDEQCAFVEAIRDFAARECGTREQRDALTDHGREFHNQELYERVAELGWLGASIPEAYGGSGGGAVDMCLLLEESTRGQIPMGFVGVSLITAGAVERFGTEELKEELLGGIV